MAVFLLWLAFWVLGGTLGPVQYHPDTPAPTYHDGGHDSGVGR